MSSRRRGFLRSLTVVAGVTFALLAVPPAAAADTVTGTIDVGLDPLGVAFTPDGGRAYVANNGDGTVSVIETSTGTVSESINVGDRPRGVAIAPDGGRAYVTNGGDNTVSVIETSTGTVSETINVGGYPIDVAITRDGGRVYVASNDGGTVSVIETSTGTVSETIDVGGSPIGVAITPDGGRVYVASNDGGTVSVIETSTGTVAETINVGGYPRGVAIAPDGGRVYVANDLDGGAVSVIDTSTDTVAETINVGNNPLGVAITPDSRRVYVANFADATVSVIDTSTGTVSETINVGYNPFGVAITPDGGRAYVANNGDNTVSVIRIEQVEQVTVSFDSRGGSAVEPQSVDVGSPVSDPGAPTRDGYVFEGWFTAVEGGTAWDFSSAVSEDMTLFARWSEVVDQVTVSFDSQGGSSVPAQSVDVGSPVSDPGAPSRDGFEFEGWFTAADGGSEWDFSSGVSEDMTLFAQWVWAPVVDRLGGADRFGTAIEVSKAGYPDGAEMVYVATGELFPDALSAAPAAVADDAPLLLTWSDVLPGEVRAELERLGPDRIVVIGGPGAVSPGVVSELSGMASVQRIAGADRFETAREVISFAFDSAEMAYLATGWDFPDALSASAAGAAQDAPVILVDGLRDQAASATVGLLQDLGVQDTVIAGGEAVVSAGIEESLTEFDPSRIDGADRYETSRLLNEDAFETADEAFLATGMLFPDALAGATLAGHRGGPLYTVWPTCIPADTLAAIESQEVGKITLFGLDGALSPAVENLTTCG